MLTSPFTGICTHIDSEAAEEYKVRVQFLVLPSSRVRSYPSEARGTFVIPFLSDQQT